MSNITKEEIAILKATTCDEEWDTACDSVKAAHGGSYPSDWFAVVLAGGVLRDTVQKWEQRMYAKPRMRHESR